MTKKYKKKIIKKITCQGRLQNLKSRQHHFLGKWAAQQMESLSNLKEMEEEEKQKEPACFITGKSQFHKIKS